MQTLKHVHWQEGDLFLGYLMDYPDYWTQGESLDELMENLADLYPDLVSGEIRDTEFVEVPCVRN